LGSELVRLLGTETGLAHGDLSITDRKAVGDAIAQHKPDVVFNCAAYNAVDNAEFHPAEAFAVNAEGPQNVSDACRRNGAAFVHFSTNFVFDGTHEEPYVESDEPNPLSVYGQSKLQGERLILGAGGHVLVIRTAAVYGGPRGFPDRFAALARKGEPLRVVSDQRINPTYARDLATAALKLADEGAAGIVHAVAEGCCAWDEFARAVLDESGIPMPVQSISGKLVMQDARRPRNGCLASTRIAPLRHWRDALHEALNP
jgi:dTDP-4-dehydrorhamnose reductase